MMNRFIGTSFSLALLFSLASPMTFAADYASVRRIADAYLDVEPPDMVAPVKISREELKAELDAGKTITLVDALPEKYFTLSHLANSINIPFEQADKAERLLPNKTAEIIVYCMDRKWPASDEVARALAAKGYTNVKVYVEGIRDWLAAGLPLEGKDPTHPAGAPHPQ